MFPPRPSAAPVSADTQGPPPFAGGLGSDPADAGGPPAVDPQLVQLLLMQMQADGLEGGMMPEAQQLVPLDPTADTMGLSAQMPGMVQAGMTSPGFMGGGMPPGMPGGMGGMPGMGLPPAFAAAQQLAAQRPQSPPAPY